MWHFIREPSLGQERLRGGRDQHVRVVRRLRQRDRRCRQLVIRRVGCVPWNETARRPIPQTGQERFAHPPFGGVGPRNDFCVCHLSDDDYTLRAHDRDAGWRKVEDATVNNNVADTR
jgi:hypothetical protein